MSLSKIPLDGIGAMPQCHSPSDAHDVLQAAIDNMHPTYAPYFKDAIKELARMHESNTDENDLIHAASTLAHALISRKDLCANEMVMWAYTTFMCHAVVHDTASIAQLWKDPAFYEVMYCNAPQSIFHMLENMFSS